MKVDLYSFSHNNNCWFLAICNLFLFLFFYWFFSSERKYFEAFMGALDVQVKEMKSMGDAIRRLESRRDEYKLIQENIHSTNGNGKLIKWTPSISSFLMISCPC